METLLLLLPALALCILMLITHTYLGLHVLARGIIFVDLALAQVAALGVSVAFLLGKEAHGITGELYALAATFTAALGFAWLRKLSNKTAREVTIGCVYVISTALSIVILSRSSQGMEELKAMLNGNILWVSWGDLLWVALVYSALILLHGIFHKKFIALSFSQDDMNGHKDVRHTPFLWEFLFFASFAVTITLAVNFAGVLLVFAFLIIPAFSASLWTTALSKQLILAWILGLLGSIAGLILSFVADLPAGATVVSVLGLLPILTGLFKILVKPEILAKSGR